MEIQRNQKFQFHQPQSVLNEDLFSKDQPNYKKKLEDILMVMAHELGHALEYLTQKDLARGNILNRFATLKNTFLFS